MEKLTTDVNIKFTKKSKLIWQTYQRRRVTETTIETQQKPPNSIRKSAESVCMGHTNLDDMSEGIHMFK